MATPIPLPPVPTDGSNWSVIRNYLTAVSARLQSLVVNPEPPDPVKGVTVTAKPSGLQITWNQAARATAYIIYRAQNSTLFSQAAAIAQLPGVGNTSFFDTGGQDTAGNVRTYWLQAVNGPTTGPLSQQAASTDPGITASIAPGSITTTMIGNIQITTPLLAANAVTAAKITAGTITATQIASATITGTQIAATTVKAANIDVTDLFAQTITASGTITGAVLKSTGSGARVEMQSGSNGFRAYDSSNNLQVRIGGLTGSSSIGIYFAGTTDGSGTGLFGTSVSVDGYVGGKETFAWVDPGSSTTTSSIYVLYNNVLTQVKFFDDGLGHKHLYV